MNKFTPSRIIKDFPSAITRSYGAGQIIVYDGDKPSHIMVVKSGAVKFYDTDNDGNEKIMHISGKGSIFPLFYAFENKDHVDSFYATLTPTELILVPMAEFRDKLRNSPAFAFEIIQWYAAQMDHIIKRLKSLERSGSRQKVLQALEYLAIDHAEKVGVRWYRTNLPITQQTLADMTGLTRETVNGTMRGLTKTVRKSDAYLEIDLDQIREQLAA